MPPENQTPYDKTPESRPHGAGPIVGVIIIVLVLLFGAYYFATMVVNQKKSPAPIPAETSTSTVAL